MTGRSQVRSRRILVVAERFNQARSRSLEELLQRDLGRWLQVSLRLGALAGSSRRLQRLGLQLAKSVTNPWGKSFPQAAHALNLLPPAPLRAKWPREQARKVAFRVLSQLSPSYDVTLLMGRRVAQALDVDEAWRFGELICCEVKLVVLPHPSGLNRIWNDSQEISRLAHTLKEVLA